MNFLKKNHLLCIISQRFMREKKESRIAKEFYISLLQNKSENEIVILLSGLIGDLVYGMAYLGKFAEKNIKKTIKIIASNNRKELINKYSLPNNCFIEFYDDLFMYNAGCFMRNKKYTLKGMERGIISTVPIYYANGKPTLQTLRDFCFDLEFPVLPSLPKITPISITTIPDFEKKKNKIVIFNNSSSGAHGTIEHTQIFFETIAIDLKNKGFDVYTNVIEGQAPIKGTKELSCSLLELYSIAKEIPLVVSIRSGITDFLVGSGVNLFILYWIGHTSLGQKNWNKVYSLKEWKTPGLAIGNIEEFVPKTLFIRNTKTYKSAYMEFTNYCKNVIQLF